MTGKFAPEALTLQPLTTTRSTKECPSNPDFPSWYFVSLVVIAVEVVGQEVVNIEPLDICDLPVDCGACSLDSRGRLSHVGFDKIRSP